MRAIAYHVSAESDTPAAAAMARTSASAAGDKTSGGRDRASISHQGVCGREKVTVTFSLPVTFSQDRRARAAQTEASMRWGKFL